MHLQHHAQLFVEQGAQRGFLAAGANLGRPVFAIAHVHAAVGNAVTLQDQHVYIEGHTLAPRESHLRHSGQQAAVAAVVVGQNFSVRAQGVDRLHQGDQVGRLVQVRHFMAHLVQGLSQDAGAHAVFATPQVHQNQAPVFHRLKLRRERAAHIGQAGKGRDDQGDRRADFFSLSILLPLRAHGQRVFAHRNRNAQGRAQLHADGAHGGIQRRVFARFAASGHPIGRELDARQVDGRSQQVGDRLGNSHAARGRRIDDGQRRALAHGHGLARKAMKVGQSHGAIGHRHLPGTDHLVAVAQAAHAAIANRDQKAFGGHCRMRQHVGDGLLQGDACHI